MSTLTRLLLIPAALTLWSTVAAAKDVPGLPKELFGNYAEREHECSVGGEYDLFNKNGRSYYYFCEGGCRAPITSHRKVKNGYMLNINWPSLFGVDKRQFFMIKDGENKFRAYFSDNQPFTLYRCGPPIKEAR